MASLIPVGIEVLSAGTGCVSQNFHFSLLCNSSSVFGAFRLSAAFKSCRCNSSTSDFLAVSVPIAFDEAAAAAAGTTLLLFTSSFFFLHLCFLDLVFYCFVHSFF